MFVVVVLLSSYVAILGSILSTSSAIMDRHDRNLPQVMSPSGQSLPERTADQMLDELLTAEQAAPRNGPANPIHDGQLFSEADVERMRGAANGPLSFCYDQNARQRELSQDLQVALHRIRELEIQLAPPQLREALTPRTLPSFATRGVNSSTAAFFGPPPGFTPDTRPEDVTQDSRSSQALAPHREISSCYGTPLTVPAERAIPMPAFSRMGGSQMGGSPPGITFVPDPFTTGPARQPRPAPWDPQQFQLYTGTAPSRDPAAPSGRDADKVLLPDLPPQQTYEAWRFQATASILAASSRPGMVHNWLAEVADPRVPFEDLARIDGPMTPLDTRLFAALLLALSSRSAGHAESELALRARTQCQAGTGRQLLRLADVEYARDASGRRQRALRLLLYMRPATETSHLEPTLLKLEQLHAEIRGTSEQPTDDMMATLVRSLFGHVQQLSAVFATADLYDLLRPGGDVSRVISAIKAQIHRMRDELAINRLGNEKQGHAQAAKGDWKGDGEQDRPKGKGGKRCTFCGRTGHDKTGCWYDPVSPCYKGAVDNDTIANLGPAQKRGKGMSAPINTYDDHLLVDSGSPFHLIDSDRLLYEAPLSPPIKLSTVAGDIPFSRGGHFDAGPVWETICSCC